MFNRIIITLLFAAYSFAGISQPYKQKNSAEILLEIEKLKYTGSVLYIAAHPDDENTRLLSWLAKEKKVRTGYLSLTRGDGGQNLIGTEKAELLGLIRTEELLAARRTDGAEQFFTRAVDFGYSKNPEETFEKWDKEEVLSDVVWVIRNFKPDLIIMRFPTTGEGGHGHHTASAILAKEAFEAAANPERFKWQLKYVQPWQSKRLLWNTFMPQRDSKINTDGLLTLDVGNYNTLLGESYGEIASRSRSMHKSQGFGSAKTRGPQTEYFKYITGGPANTDIFEGVITDVRKIKGGKSFAAAIEKIIKNFDPSKPEKSIKALVEAYDRANKIKDVYRRDYIQALIKEIISDCSGIWFEATSTNYFINPDQSLNIDAHILLRNPANIRLEKIIYNQQKDTLLNLQLQKHQPLKISQTIKIPENTEYSIPFWLRNPPQENLWNLKDITMLSLPREEAPLSVEFCFITEKFSFCKKRPVMYKWVDPVEGERYRNVEVIPETMINFNHAVYIFKKGEAKSIDVTVKAGADNVAGSLSLKLPEGWKSEPQLGKFKLSKKEEEVVLNFKVTPSAKTKWNSTYSISAIAESNAGLSTKAITKIDYKHIPFQTLIHESAATITTLDAAVNKLKIGYIPGADDLPDYLIQLGYDITIIDESKIDATDLSRFDVIITGIRAFNMHERLKLNSKKLHDYVEKGGNLVVQYNTSNFTGVIDYSIGPYPFKITRNRVTDENAEVKFINPAHKILSTPNKLTSKDFEGWVQERGLYFAGDTHEKYQEILSMSDPGEDAQKGSLIVAHYGKGSFIYTGLAFFRQLPAGVPGAYRLFTNIISYKQGK
jgi:LmbE family N-acetylglucosaminyl deacetylase